ncbi:hypothetical protein A1Q1_02494 [Trichosporon asahii var. asahii CBS 2479]|uniref:Uncharacterized protein n=1 Tax=Trichosporon asahii var. asahii (strain ATCC 90039 / CBS 2479 / JCM 2466 / KCTC 7840 / NBRC 103889/ NCYC 2677 / UAMH 7654) TaxID=1186058 RepID=J5QPU6_TRIAS|nr:hypothetical protein A1Q1_02494 [Trichosporon asahii var. asahii CBS 2479]EJT48473.1 hypothetical protein A1Q1_02494 [Trichosporon asahii var. asahii CBS 2479]
MNSPAQASPDAWRRRLSHPSLSTPSSTPLTESPSGGSYLPLPLHLPSVSGLRAALLGYLGEAEAALRERLEVESSGYFDGEGDERAHSPPVSSEDETDNTDSDTPMGTSTAVQAHGQLRRRRAGPSSPLEEKRFDPIEPGVLDQLAKLREDVISLVPGNAKEWLHSLPTQLHRVDNCLADPLSAPKHAIKGARRRVIDVVHAMLPPDDWEGWERLGWDQGEGEGEDDESTPRQIRHIKSCSLDGQYSPEDDEPEYLFPNRTPAPAQAVARHRHRRARSLGAADVASLPPFLDQLDQWIRPALTDVSAIVDDTGEAAPVEEVVESGEETEDADSDDLEPCEKHGAHLASPYSCPSIEESLVRSDYGAKLITFEDLPFWWRNNQYIHTGYRFIPLGKSGPIPLIKSAFALHNETVNIQSHLIPTVLILAVIPLIVWKSPLPNAHWIDTAMLVSYLLAATSCLFSSASWHVLSGCSNKRWFEWGACVDYIGISWLIAMSFNTVVYNAYYCSPKTVLFYTTVNVAFGALGSYLPFQKWFNQRKNKHWRILFFLALNVAMFAPCVQLFGTHGLEAGFRFVKPFTWSILSYVLGLICYAFHFPECKFPGRFDRLGASHQLWHTGIVCAIYLHYRAIFAAYNARWEYSCMASEPSASLPMVVTQMLFSKA